MKDLHCVHLDFHTSERIENIGADFCEEEFISALKAAEIDSINIFAKCHHGCFYYYSDKFYTHPHLSKPLLDLQIEACRKAGVSSKIYISAGLDEHSVRTHPEWLLVKPNGEEQSILKFRRLCFNTPYLDLLTEQTEEVVKRFMPDGIFLDIISEADCVCPDCVRSMKEAGLDPKNPDHVSLQAKKTLNKFTSRIISTAKSIKPDILVFFNAGDVPVGNRDYIDTNDQLELESLPTGGWGYDHFPMTMAYARRLGKNCIGMTGKFHRSWGEFGGFKYRDALLYEGAQCTALDAGLCVGDQLHPSGRVDKYTYENTGNAVRFMKKYEPWRGGEFLPELAVLVRDGRRNAPKTFRTGISRMLFEAKYLFDIISVEEISNKYPLIILSDSEMPLDIETAERLKAYTENGGKILACCNAPVLDGSIPFDLGAKYLGEDTFVPAYVRADYTLDTANGEALLIHDGKQTNIELTEGGRKLADKLSPYFVREGSIFCSHKHTPCDYSKVSPAITEGADGIYITADLFLEYATYGSLNPKQLLLPLLDRLLCDKKVIKTNIPSSGKALLYKKNGSHFLHLLYANTIKRGDGVEIIEDLVTLADIHVSLDIGVPVSEITAHPEEQKINFTTSADGRVEFTLDRFKCYDIIEVK